MKRCTRPNASNRVDAGDYEPNGVDRGARPLTALVPPVNRRADESPPPARRPSPPFPRRGTRSSGLACNESGRILTEQHRLGRVASRCLQQQIIESAPDIAEADVFKVFECRVAGTGQEYHGGWRLPPRVHATADSGRWSARLPTCAQDRRPQRFPARPGPSQPQATPGSGDGRCPRRSPRFAAARLRSRARQATPPACIVRSGAILSAHTGPEFGTAPQFPRNRPPPWSR